MRLPRGSHRRSRNDLPTLTRRELFRTAGVVSVAAIVAGNARGDSSILRSAPRANPPRVVVVGAGLAGLTAAYRIGTLTGWPVHVYEAQERVGGRVKTIRGLAGGQYTEAGASGISAPERAIRSLCRELDLTPLVDNYADYPTGRDLFRFKGVTTTREPDTSDAEGTAYRHFRQLDWPVTYRNAGAGRNRHWDAITAAEWIERFVDGGLSGRTGSFIAEVFAADYGGTVAEASAIHLIADLGGTIWPGGWGNERFAVPGGNDVLATTLGGKLGSGRLHLGHALRSIRRRSDATYRLSFDHGNEGVELEADRVVLALPFTALQDVDLSRAGFLKRKRTAIRALGMGRNAKLNAQFHGRPWADLGRSGDSDSDLVTGETWQSSWQPGPQAILLMLTTRHFAPAWPHAKASSGVVGRAMHAVDTLWPGSSDRLVHGQIYLDDWPSDPWVKGSYSFYRPGGFTSIAGVEAERAGNVHFAGEHTARYIARGYMNGAVESAERAAREVTSY